MYHVSCDVTVYMRAYDERSSAKASLIQGQSAVVSTSRPPQTHPRHVVVLAQTVEFRVELIHAVLVRLVRRALGLVLALQSERQRARQPPLGLLTRLRCTSSKRASAAVSLRPEAAGFSASASFPLALSRASRSSRRSLRSATATSASLSRRSSLPWLFFFFFLRGGGQLSRQAGLTSPRRRP